MAALAHGHPAQRHGPREIARWTAAMIDSGERMDSRPSPAHRRQTSRVASGDKITLPLALCAACGAPSRQLSGRGLGHNRRHPRQAGGHPRWRASLSNEEMLAVLGDAARDLCRGDGLAPADKKRTRRTSRTVESIR